MKTYKVTGGGGIQLHVEEDGNSKGRPILFIHGFSQCRLAWGKQMNSDLTRDFRLVVMDIRGHGLSDKPRDAYGDSRLWAEDVNAVIETLALDRPILSGWSYGGFIICDYIRFYSEDRIGGINLVAAVTKISNDIAPRILGADFLALVPGFFSNDVQESVRNLQVFLRMCTHAEPTLSDFYLTLGYNVIVPPYVREGLFSRTLDNDDLLARIERPVLITHGEKDALVLPVVAREHAAAIRHARVAFYPEVGHAPFLEDAERFNREIRAFAGSIDSSVSPS